MQSVVMNQFKFYLYDNKTFKNLPLITTLETYTISTAKILVEVLVQV